MHETKAPKLSVIIVNYYSEKLVENCISSLIKYNDEEIEVVVVDNGSEIDLSSIYNQKDIRIIRNEKNMGFGYACNIGVKNSRSRNILFLNPDTTVFENSIRESLAFFKTNPQITVLGCQQVDENGNVHRTCTRFLTLNRYLIKSLYLDKLFPKIFKSHLMTYWDHQSSQQVDHVMGSFYMIRRETFEELNGFDEEFFVYYEDLDMSKRITDSGGKVYFNSDFQIYHKLGGTSEKVKAERLSYSLEGVLKYSKKHFSTVEYFFMLFFVLVIEFFFRITFSVLKLSLNNLKEVIRGYTLLYKKVVLNY